MELTESETPVLVYRGLLFCDLCGGTLAKGETISGICKVCQVTLAPRFTTRGRRKATRRPLTQARRS